MGVRVTPHLFRDCLATTVATVDPEHVQITMSLLGHSSPVIAERFYNHANSLEAGRAHQANIGRLRQDLRRISARRPKKR